VRKVRPYRTLEGLLKACDNGGPAGRLSLRRGDGRIDVDELVEASSAMTGTAAPLVFLELAQSRLAPWAQHAVWSALNDELREALRTQRPPWVTPSSWRKRSRLGLPVIVTGALSPAEPVGVESPSSQFYELHDLEDARAVPVPVRAYGRPAPRQPAAVGGVMHRRGRTPAGAYLAAWYYLPLAEHAADGDVEAAPRSASATGSPLGVPTWLGVSGTRR
jgi:hypothetical protein